jgi:SAM-dependent methyltransferase
MQVRRPDWQALQYWYRSPAGRQCGAAEAAVLNTTLAPLYGYTIMTLGIPAVVDYLQASPIAHRIHLDINEPQHSVRLDVLAEPGYLPIAGDCIDVVVLPHNIEFQTQPLQVLHEIDRVLIPEGHVVIIGFNPLSLWYLLRSLNIRWNKLRFPSLMDWQGHLISAFQLRSWLIELGFEIRSVQYYTFPTTMGKRYLLRGSGYMLLAKKKVSTITPIKPRWYARRTRLIATGLAERVLGKKHG